jgi:ATP-binding cassette, subfamily C, bacterial CydC
MRTAWRLIALCRPHLPLLLAGVALNVGVVLANVGLLALAGWFITAMALAGLGITPIEYFAPAAAIRGLALLRTGGRYLERLVTHEATFALLATLRVWLYRRLEPLAPARLQTHRGGDLLSRLRSDVDSLENFYLRVLAPTVAAALSGLLLVAFLALYDPPAALALALGLTVAGLCIPVAAERLGRAPGRRAVAIRADLRSDMTDLLRGLGDLTVYGGVEARAAAIHARGQALTAAQRRQARLGILGVSLSGAAATLTLAGALCLMVSAVRAATLTGPELTMAAFLVLAAFEAVAPLPAAFQALGETLAAARRIFALVDAAPAVTEPRQGAPLPSRYGITIRGLRMRYDEAAPWALDGLDLDVPEGRRLGIVGASGAGKTSLFNVLLRFWDYQAGSITIGGLPLQDLDGDTVRGLFSVVAQHTHLFNASIGDNLRVARPGASADELLNALHRAHLGGDVAAFENGLDTMIGENGTLLSGGQARRLAIARAFLRDAPILLLDEPTEGLDADSERAVLDGLRTLMVGRTTVLITHRRAALRDLDVVISLSGGRACAAPPGLTVR